MRVIFTYGLLLGIGGGLVAPTLPGLAELKLYPVSLVRVLYVFLSKL